MSIEDDNEQPESQIPTEMNVLLVYKQPRTQGSQDVTYDVSIATVDLEGEILSTRSLGSVDIEKSENFSFNIASALRNMRSDINRDYKDMEQVATHVLSQIPEEEFYSLVSSHQGMEYLISQRRSLLQHRDHPLGDNVISQAAQWKERHKQTAFDASDHDASLVNPATFQDNPFYDPRENLFAQAQMMLEDYVKDPLLKEKIKNIDYFQDNMRLVIHEAVNQSLVRSLHKSLNIVMPEGEALEKLMADLDLPQVETVAELVEIVYQTELRNAVPTWTSCYDMAAKDVLQHLMPKILDHVTDEKQEITTMQQVESLCAAMMPSKIANQRGEHPQVSFSAAMNDAAREVGFSERSRTQTYEHTSRKMLQDAFMLGTIAARCEQAQRVLPSYKFEEDGLLVLFPAFKEEAQERQAVNLSGYDADVIMETLPNVMHWLMARIEKSIGINLGAPAIVEDVQRLVHIYDRAVEIKLQLHDPDMPQEELETLKSFKGHLEQMCERVDALKSSDELFGSIEWDERLLGHILTGAPQYITLTRFIPAEIEVRLKPMSEDELEQKAADLTLISEAIDEVYQQAPDVYKDALITAQMALYQESLFYPIGIEQINTETQKLSFTKDFFLLPSTEQEPVTDMLLAYMHDMPQERVACILAYNLLEVMEVYKAFETQGAEVALTDEMLSMSGETLSDRIGTIRWYAENLEKVRAANLEENDDYEELGTPDTKVTDTMIDRGAGIAAEDLLQEAYNIAVNREVMVIENLKGTEATIGKFFRERFFNDVYARMGIDIPKPLHEQQRAS
ncbi:MAG: hypothetical protein EAY65_04375 [Alphaproteobacteria bacterium]|nr:MAG: hypothetical protein EAY65_04375 [Alphaproteobacteria bacterium]